MFACPCCGYLTFAQQPTGTYDVCPVCYWTDDPQQFYDPSLQDGCNKISLNAARENYASFGAACREDIKHVRFPRAYENQLYEQIRTTLPNNLPDSLVKEAKSLAPAEPYIVGWTRASINEMMRALDGTDIAVATGEVYHVISGNVCFTYVDWPCTERKTDESMYEYAKRTREQTLQFVNSYIPPEGASVLYALWFKQK